MGQVNADMRLDRIVEGVEPERLALEHAAALEAAREVIAYAESRGFKVTWARVAGGHEETLADRHGDTMRAIGKTMVNENAERAA